MDTASLEERIQTALQGAFDDQVSANVRMEGNHAFIDATSERFAGLSRVKRHQLVYSALSSYIESGEVHAVHLTLATPEEALK